MGSRTYAPRGAHIARVITNRYAGTCNLCRNRVEAEAGVAMKDNAGGKWVTQHKAGECPPPAAPAAPKVYPQPELGYYVRADGAGIKVVEGRRNEDGTRRRYGLVFTPRTGQRPHWAYVRGAGVSVADLRPMNAHDAGLLGLAHGFCINCCAPLGGATLSAQVAALIGYGEVCAAGNGWYFPKGVAAQRAFMVERGK